MGKWIAYAVSCSLVWGTGYTILAEIGTKLSVYTINIIYGLSLVLINIVLCSIVGDFNNFNELKDYKLALYLFGYVILFVSASFLYLIGYNAPGTPKSAFVAITSTYPIVTFILAYILHIQNNSNLRYSIPGILLIVGGVILLALS